MGYEVQNLTCQRGDRIILESVNLSVDPGAALILRGPNGCGKTTLLRCLAGLTPAVSGDIGFAPDDVAYAAHADGLKFQLTARENLQFWADIYGQPDISAAISTFDLEGMLERPAQYLSAGQKRRLSLARLTLTGRALWTLDEPTVSLDAENVARFATAVETHLADGGAAIIATHIDLGLPQAQVLDVTQFRAKHPEAANPFLDEAFT